MHFRRIMFLLLVVPVFLLPSVWFTAPLWLAKTTEYILAQKQCSEVVIDIDRVGWNRIHIKRLYCKDQKNTFDIELSNADISYNFTGLMEKRIEHVTLESVVLHLRASPKANAESIPTLTTPALLLDAVPVSNFEIRNIYLQRQNVEGDVLQTLKGYANYSDKGLSLALNEDAYLKGLQIKVNMDKKNGVRAALSRGSIPIFNIESTLHKTDNLFSIDGIADIELKPLSAELKPWLNMPNQQLEGKLHASWQVSSPVQGSKVLLQQLKASTALHLDFSLNRPDLGLSHGKVGLNMKLKHGLGVWNIAERSHINFGDKQKTMIDLSGLSGSFAHTRSGWRAAVAEKSKLQVKNVHIGGMLITHTQISASTPIAIEKTSKGDMQIVRKTAITMGLPTLQWQGNSLAGHDLQLVIQPGSMLSPSGSFIASAIKFTSPALRIPESNISGTFNLSGNHISVTGKVDARESGIHLDWQLNHQLVRQKGVLEFSSEPLLFGATGIDLSRIVRSQADYAIDSGTLSLKGRLQWQKDRKKQQAKLDSQFTLKFSNLNGHYNANRFSGLGGNLNFTGDQSKLLMAPALLTLNSLYAGLPVNNISMRAAFTYPFGGLARVEISQLTAEALGGSISSEKISIDFSRASNPFLVQLKHLDAGNIAKVSQQEGLYIRGLLDGNLPFNWTSDGLTMTSGKLNSTPAGGLIRYLGTESVRRRAATDQATRMVLDIMNDFHFKHLKLGADYRPDGELKMRIHLKGRNPGYENGRPVEFNFNIEDNLLKLLQGLNIASDLGGAVEKSVQKQLQRE